MAIQQDDVTNKTVGFVAFIKNVFSQSYISLVWWQTDCIDLDKYLSSWQTPCVVHDTTQAGSKKLFVFPHLLPYIFFSEIDLYNFDVTEVKVSVLKRRNSLKCCLTEAVFLLSLSSLSESSVLSLVLSEDEGTGVQMDNGFCIMQKVAYFIIIHFVRQWSVNNSIWPFLWKYFTSNLFQSHGKSN